MPYPALLAGFFIPKIQSNKMQIIGYVLLLVMQDSAMPITEDIYTQSECNKRAEYLMSVKNLTIICGEIIHGE